MNATSGMAEASYHAHKYLNTEQALEDPVYFAHYFQLARLEQYWLKLALGNSPWVWLGDSYPEVRGTLSWLDLKSPLQAVGL